MKIILSDETMKASRKGTDFSLSFREKLELAKLLDRLGLDYIEVGSIESRRSDGLLVKSVSSAVKEAGVTVTVPALEDDGVAYAWSCLREAKKPRLQVALPVSTVQMEYLYHKKPDAMLALIERRVAECAGFTDNVEFCAEDAGRADWDFLIRAVKAAEAAGAAVVTVCDTAGNMLPRELHDRVAALRSELGENTALGVRISGELYMAEACALYAVKAGAAEVKVVSCGTNTASVEKLATIIKARGDDLGGASTGIRVTQLSRTARQIEWLCRTNRSKASPFDSGVRESEEFTLNRHDDAEAVKRAAERLGYDLSEEDSAKVYEAFLSVAGKKDGVSARELDVIIAASALQVPPTYTLESYVINSGSIITATSHVRLRRRGEVLGGLSEGDGPIDASFLAIEQITGSHYELDDFQIRAVTESREAMGETVVRLRAGGRLYSGRGLSTDIVGSSIMAYVNALNKIVYEENEQ